MSKRFQSLPKEQHQAEDELSEHEPVRVGHLHANHSKLLNNTSTLLYPQSLELFIPTSLSILWTLFKTLSFCN